jgi:hypothetical protein
MDKNIITEVSKKLNLPEDVVELAYKSLWEFIRNKIQELPLKEDLDFNDFLKLRTNFNIPSLGKLSCTYDRMLKVKKKYNYIKNAKN